MNKSKGIAAITLILFSMLLSSCEAIAGIFKAGMGFGIFIVIFVIIGIIALVFKMGKGKN